MVDRRRAGVNWNVTDETGNLHSSMKDAVTVALLMDIRDELQRLNALLHCSSFTNLPRELRGLRRDLKKLKE